MEQPPVIIVGSGIAGLHAALKIGQHRPVLLLTKAGIASSNSRWAQGGIAAVVDKFDSFEAHIADTMAAGANHNKREAVEFMVKKGPAVIDELLEFGVDFAQENGELALTQEGGHGQRRIAYKGDITGLEIEQKLIAALKELKNVEIREQTFVVDLVVEQGECRGVVVLKGNGVETVWGAAVVLATGGLGQIYRTTTNPDVATGDGFAMAYRAEVKVRDMEFIQFHPTVFVRSDGRRPLLISEAVRGEGAYVVNEAGERFLLEVDERGELAARDVVARAIYAEGQKGQVYIDARHEDPSDLEERFPYIFETLQEYGLNLARDLIPIEPAAHFSCGGIETDLKGRTSLPGLYAFGEVAWTGVHGANRLASNSLLEALAFSMEIAKELEEVKEQSNILTNAQVANDWGIAISVISKLSDKRLDDIESELRETMQNMIGIIRNSKEMKKAKNALIKLEDELYGLCQGNGEVGNPSINVTRFIQLLNGMQAGLLVAEAAIRRPYSLGGHRVDKSY